MNKGKKIKSVGGSGRGNRGVSRLDDPLRPDCPRCGGFMKSNGKRGKTRKSAEWKCTECGKYVSKNVVEEDVMNEEFKRLGYDVDKAEERAKYIESRYKNGCKSFVITSAQNNTGEFKAFLESLKTYCKHKRAELIIIPVHYKNANAWTKDTVKEWPKAIEPYLVHGQIDLGHVAIMSHIKIEAPSINPLQGKHGYCGNRWIVFGNAQHQMLPVATPPDMMPKRMYTTGSVTKKNYSISDRGAKADFNHIYGAITVNFVEGQEIPFVRHLNADGKGGFYDLDKKFTPKGIEKGKTIEALCTGDEHCKFNEVEKETYQSKTSITKKLKPKYIIRHDLLDGYAQTHHDLTDPLTRYKKYIAGDDNYKKELDECVDFVNRTTPKGTTNIIVASNHLDHLDKWLNRADPNKDFLNADLILDLRARQFEAVRNSEDKSAFQIYAENLITAKTRFLSRNERFMVEDVDYSNHGDCGQNGSRGSRAVFARFTFKVTVGHGHEAWMDKGAMGVGASAKRFGYERGASTHSVTHAIQYTGGKRTHIDIIDGTWCEYGWGA